MDFELSKEHQDLRQRVREFADKVIRPRARQLDEHEEFSLETMAAMAAEGLFGLNAPLEYGGQGLDYTAYILAVEELARVDGSHAATVAAANSLGIGPLAHFGDEAQKQKYLPGLCEGKALWAFGLTEPNAGSDAGACATRARLDGDQWVINGDKVFITNSSSPITQGVTALVNSGQGTRGRPELSCILVEQGTAGFEARRIRGKMMWRASNTGALSFKDCRVPRENLLGEQGQGFKQMLATLDAGRLAIAAMGVGGAQGAYDLALKYGKKRKQFGRAISSFQSNAFKLVDMAMEIEAARLMLYKACWQKDHGRPYAKMAAMAKLYASEVMGRVASEAVQLHGAYGLIKDNPVERFFRDQKLLTIGEGTSEIQRLVLAREIGAL